MIKTMFVFGVLAVAAAGAVPAGAQAAAGASLPKCSATVRDSCDQSMTSERNAMTADQAMKTGGVGDRKSDQAAKGAMAGPMMHKATMHHHMMAHHKMMKTPAMMTPDVAAEPMPK